MPWLAALRRAASASCASCVELLTPARAAPAATIGFPHRTRGHALPASRMTGAAFRPGCSRPDPVSLQRIHREAGSATLTKPHSPHDLVQEGRPEPFNRLSARAMADGARPLAADQAPSANRKPPSYCRRLKSGPPCNCHHRLMPPIISIANVSKTYATGFRALERINLEI